SDRDLSLVVEEALSAYAALTIRWTKQAIVYDFVSASNPRAAKATIDTIDHAITGLALHPRMARSGRTG
ncbi:MAG TPA: type II toxin-antitoxin system RelE/ParE family toxin, partial [Geminicoccaceae bacterium]|nr:type II toxin-antitoxin system RelE/ParE family toxin [Geminicoccaceae bacterium]